MTTSDTSPDSPDRSKLTKEEILKEQEEFQSFITRNSIQYQLADLISYGVEHKSVDSKENSIVISAEQSHIPFEMKYRLIDENSFKSWYLDLISQARYRKIDIFNPDIANEEIIVSNFKAAIYMSISEKVLNKIGGYNFFSQNLIDILSQILLNYREYTIKQAVEIICSILENTSSNQSKKLLECYSVLIFYTKKEESTIMASINARQSNPKIYEKSVNLSDFLCSLMYENEVEEYNRKVRDLVNSSESNKESGLVDSSESIRKESVVNSSSRGIVKSKNKKGKKRR